MRRQVRCKEAEEKNLKRLFYENSERFMRPLHLREAAEILQRGLAVDNFLQSSRRRNRHACLVMGDQFAYFVVER